mgnify:CR=1 FL=1
MTTDLARVLGRDVFGEPKRLCTTHLNRGGDRMSGWVERHGVRLIEIAGDLPVEHGPTEGQGANFNIKATPSCSGATT